VTPEVPSIPIPSRTCRRCSRELSPNALACDSCHALVYADRLDQIAGSAKALEEQGDHQQARERWLSALALLPPSSTQAQWIHDHARELDSAQLAIREPANLTGISAGSEVQSSSGNKGLLRFAALLSFLAFAAIYSRFSGAQFGVGFAVLILIHEMGHYVDIRRRGLPADMPIFLPGLGAYVRWRALGVSLETRAAISLAGPLAGFFSAAACGILWWQTHDPYWALLARVGAALNLLNLIPIWVLDGGHAALALNKGGRISLLASSLLLWMLLRQNVLLVFAAGAAFRCFSTKDVPSRPSPFITAYFLAVLAALAILLRLLPGRGLGTP
jgi:Zn-dependent protease